MRKWFEILKTGTHTDSAGNAHTFTESDLDGIVAGYDPARHEAPIVIGHPKENAPAYGWIEALKRVGDTLLAAPKQLVPEFVEMVNQGLFKKRSVSLFPDRTLRHVGFLGAAPPAVKGLADVTFAQADETIFVEQDGQGEFSEEPSPAPPKEKPADFSDWRVPSIGRILTNLREWLIEKFGTETADKIVSSYDLDELKQYLPDPVPAAATMAAAAAPEIPSPDAEVLAENARLKAELDQERKNSRRQEAASFCDGLTREGRLIPAVRADCLDLMEVLHSVGAFEFSEGGSAAPLERFKALLSKLPKAVEMEEIGKGGARPADMSDPKAIAAAAVEFQDQEAKAGRTITVTQAVAHVTKGR